MYPLNMLRVESRESTLNSHSLSQMGTSKSHGVQHPGTWEKSGYNGHAYLVPLHVGPGPCPPSLELRSLHVIARTICWRACHPSLPLTPTQAQPALRTTHGPRPIHLPVKPAGTIIDSLPHWNRTDKSPWRPAPRKRLPWSRQCQAPVERYHPSHSAP